MNGEAVRQHLLRGGETSRIASGLLGVTALFLIVLGIERIVHWVSLPLGPRFGAGEMFGTVVPLDSLPCLVSCRPTFGTSCSRPSPRLPMAGSAMVSCPWDIRRAGGAERSFLEG